MIDGIESPSSSSFLPPVAGSAAAGASACFSCSLAAPASFLASPFAAAAPADDLGFEADLGFEVDLGAPPSAAPLVDAGLAFFEAGFAAAAALSSSAGAARYKRQRSGSRTWGRQTRRVSN